MPEMLDVIKANWDRRQEIQGEIRSVSTKATEEKRAFTEDEQAKIDEFRSELDAVDGRVTETLKMELRSQELEGGLAKYLGGALHVEDGDVVDTRSLGAKFADSDDYRAWAKGAHGSYAVDYGNGPEVDLRAVTNATTGATSAGAFNPRQHIDRVGRDFLDRRTYLLDLLPTIPATNGIIEYVQDKSPLADMADKAAETTESSGAKPQAGITTALVTETVATIAAWVNITRQAAADIPQIEGYLDTRLRYSLKRRSDGQAINGNGTPPNLTGLLNRSGILTYAPGAAEARYITIRHAITVMENAESVPEIIVLNPADAELFDLSNAAVSGLHAVPNLALSGSTTAWGLRQVHSTAIASGTAMLLDPLAVAVFDRMGATAYMTDSHASQFINNILTLLLEVRLGLGLFDVAGVCKVTFNGTT